ncbi:hypothetical protein [Streptomyces sp. B21-083]|uniref:hypothetical protein n=1 Tax=Streptomyces sp. B21-083 TaxID=3039410 RepID=UPI002FF40FB8
MPGTCKTDDIQEEAVTEHRMSPGADAYIQSYAESVERECRESRKATRVQSHLRLAKLSVVMPIGAMTVLVVATVVAFAFWGMHTAAGLPIGAVSAAMYTAVNDARISVVHDNPGWRRRHRILAWLVPGHPSD